ncbi:hypothetical protein NPIL_16071 [Nephila pilipes]|uniref:Uncharacterized protein n=1 Tax=Nephila pilipes TaxID=299642 RepID=A0A8X6QM64_NEPPI|nr:hypothetical protein NPIL_16071 [Nephila pilipes]
MASCARCPSYPKPPKGTTKFRNSKPLSSKLNENYTFAQAITNAPRPQMAPPKTSETEVYAQSEARFHRKPLQNNHPQYNRQGNNLAQPTDLLFILADLLNKFPGLAQQLPRIAAVKNNRNQKYAIIEALLESESYV